MLFVIHYLACLVCEALTILGAEAVPPRFLDDGEAVAITDLRKDHSTKSKVEDEQWRLELQVLCELDTVDTKHKVNFGRDEK